MEITVRDLRKEYDHFIAVESLNFEIEKGEIFGIVGPNGAGKTTTLKMLSGLIIPTKGRITIQGMDIKKDARRIKQKLGFLPEESPMYEGMSANDYLMFFAERPLLRGASLRDTGDEPRLQGAVHREYSRAAQRREDRRDH